MSSLSSLSLILEDPRLLAVAETGEQESREGDVKLGVIISAARWCLVADPRGGELGGLGRSQAVPHCSLTVPTINKNSSKNCQEN